MHLIISEQTPIPLYEQIAQQLKIQIYDGSLQEGNMLPSIRTLSQQLQVSIITVRRAYNDLENDGFIESIPAKGSFVSNRYIKRLKQLGTENMMAHLATTIRLAHVLNISKEQLVELLTAEYDNNQRSDDEAILSYLGIQDIIIKRG